LGLYLDSGWFCISQADGICGSIMKQHIQHVIKVTAKNLADMFFEYLELERLFQSVIETTDALKRTQFEAQMKTIQKAYWKLGYGGK
jgi:hypothetical protein